MLFCGPDESAMLNLMCVLMSFLVVWLNINFTKSEIVRLEGERDIDRLTNVLGCKAVKLSIKYLGLQLVANYKEIRAWNPVVIWFEKTLAGWKRVLLCKGRRPTLIKSSVGQLAQLLYVPIYYFDKCCKEIGSHPMQILIEWFGRSGRRSRSQFPREDWG